MRLYAFARLQPRRLTFSLHRYEFRPNEFISTLKAVSLATRSTVSGRKDFIAVGTTVYRAEDLAARGGVSRAPSIHRRDLADLVCSLQIYLFEVIKVNPDPSTPHVDHQLKLLFFEDTKSVVGNLCDINGHLIMSMGQKLYARAFEQDEVLLAVGFLDVGVHVTSLQSMKNFLLIGDALQSVTLVAFQVGSFALLLLSCFSLTTRDGLQEDPYKLVLLGRDYRPARVASANFLINDGKVSFIVGDVSGVLRLFEYDPTSTFLVSNLRGQSSPSPTALSLSQTSPPTLDNACSAEQSTTLEPKQSRRSSTLNALVPKPKSSRTVSSTVRLALSRLGALCSALTFGFSKQAASTARSTRSFPSVTSSSSVFNCSKRR